MNKYNSLPDHKKELIDESINLMMNKQEYEDSIMRGLVIFGIAKKNEVTVIDQTYLWDESNFHNASLMVFGVKHLLNLFTVIYPNGDQLIYMNCVEDNTPVGFAPKLLVCENKGGSYSYNYTDRTLYLNVGILTFYLIHCIVDYIDAHGYLNINLSDEQNMRAILENDDIAVPMKNMLERYAEENNITGDDLVFKSINHIINNNPSMIRDV